MEKKKKIPGFTTGSGDFIPYTEYELYMKKSAANEKRKATRQENLNQQNWAADKAFWRHFSRLALEMWGQRYSHDCIYCDKGIIFFGAPAKHVFLFNPICSTDYPTNSYARYFLWELSPHPGNFFYVHNDIVLEINGTTRQFVRKIDETAVVHWILNHMVSPSYTPIKMPKDPVKTGTGGFYIEDPDNVKTVDDYRVELAQKFYRLWIGYLKRYLTYPFNLSKNEEKLAFRLQIFSYVYQNEYFCNLFASNSFDMIDETLCVKKRIGSEETLFPVDQEWVNQFPSYSRKDIKNLLRLVQSYKAKEARAAKKAEEYTVCYLRYLYVKASTIDPTHIAQSGYYRDLSFHKSRDKFCEQKGPSMSFCEVSSIIRDKCIVVDSTKHEDDEHDTWLFLYELFQGDIDALIEFADFLLDSFSVNVRKGRPIYLVHSSLMPWLCKLLEKIGGRPIRIYFTAGEITKVDAIDGFIADKSNGICMMPLELKADALKKLSSERKTRLKKLITGAQVAVDDKLLGRKKYVNNLQFVGFGEDTVEQLLENVGIPVRRLSLQIPIHANYDEPLPVQWMQKVLLPWALLRRLKKLPKEDCRQIKSTSIPISLSVFVSKCCEMREGKECEGNILYTKYKEFCEVQSCDPLLRKNFDKQLQEQYSLERYRPHYKKDRNPYYFKGISPCLEGETKDEDLSNSSVKIPAFVNKIEEMNQAVQQLYEEIKQEGC